MERIMISGIGIVSPIGIDSDNFFKNLLNESGVFEIESQAYAGHGDDKKSSRLSHDMKAEIDLQIENSSDLPQTLKYALYATKMALKDAGLTQNYLSGKRVSVIIGSNDSESEILDQYIDNGNWSKGHYSSYNISKTIAEYFNLNGMRLCVHNACASSNMSVDIALSFLRNGQSDIVIAGGADSFSIKNYTGFNSLMAVSKTDCRPFSKYGDGITISEGSGIVILEKESDLACRNHKAYCSILGAGSSNDAFHLTKPSENGILLSADKAFDDAGISRKDVDYVMAHGTGTLTNDITESAVIKEIFGACNLKGVCSIKGTLGHMMGAAGAVALVAICLIYKNGVIPPASKSLPVDEKYDINVVTEKTVDNNIGIFMNNSFGFGGNNSILILAPCDYRSAR